MLGKLPLIAGAMGPIFDILEHLELCFSVDDGKENYLFPGALRSERPATVWVDDPSRFSYVFGRRIVCRRSVDIILPGVMTRLQVR